jgi:hypothetical protein
MKMGRYVMAALMAEAVQKAQDAQVEDDDWLGYIFDKMAEGVDSFTSFATNNVKFVTFNFDTIIEDRFRADLRRTFRDAGTDFPTVIHVHGKLPTVPANPIIDLVRAFHPSWRKWLEEAASNINVVIDAIDDKTLEAARNAVLKANIVCFLGFAYASPNLDRLGLLEAVRKGQGTPAMFSSAYQMDTGEQAWITSRVHSRIQLSDAEHRCLQALRKLHIFRD